VMASSVNRRIESDLLWVKGQCDPVSLIRSRSTVPIRACGLGRANKAGHMTASDHRATRANKSLASRGPSTHDPEQTWTWAQYIAFWAPAETVTQRILWLTCFDTEADGTRIARYQLRVATNIPMWQGAEVKTVNLA
jgi:hypothetical protein